MKAHGSYWRLIGLTVLGGLALVLAGCVVAPGVAPGPPRADVPDLAALHDAKSPSFNKNCLSCHGDIMTRTTLNPKFKEAHAAMVPFAPGYDAKVGVTNETCTSCHGKVDLLQHSGEQIRKNADVASCGACHGKSGPSSKKFYAN
jgi:hypothetical protein